MQTVVSQLLEQPALQCTSPVQPTACQLSSGLQPLCSALFSSTTLYTVIHTDTILPALCTCCRCLPCPAHSISAIISLHHLATNTSTVVTLYCRCLPWPFFSFILLPTFFAYSWNNSPLYCLRMDSRVNTPFSSLKPAAQRAAEQLLLYHQHTCLLIFHQAARTPYVCRTRHSIIPMGTSTVDAFCIGYGSSTWHAWDT